MNRTLMAMTIGTLLATGSNAFAASTHERLAGLEKRLAYLEQHVAAQNKVIAQKNDMLAKLGNSNADLTGGWFQSVEIGGLVEVEATHSDNGPGAPDSADAQLATAELGIAAQVNDWVVAELVLLYEDDGTHGGQFDVDTALVTLADPDNIWFVNAGQYVVPFGVYDTNMVSDPLTLEVGETGDVAVEVGIKQDGMFASAYVLNGDQASNNAVFGATAGVAGEASSMKYTAQLGYINDLAESDAIVDDGTAMTGRAGAYIVSASLAIDNITLIGEYLAATETLSGYGEKPSVFNLEAGLGFDMGGLPATVAVRYQGTEDAAATAGGMPESRMIGALSVEIADGTSLAFEYARDEAYGGGETNTVTGQLGVEF